MQQFTFHRKAEQLRADVLVWQVAACAEAAVMVLMGFFIPAPGNFIMLLLVTPAYFAFVWWLYSRPLRRRHLLTATTLTLVDKAGVRFAIPRDRIGSIEPFTGSLPRGLKPVTTKVVPQEDTLYILPGKTSLVAITLNSPVRAKMPPRYVVEFTRVVCVVDEPEAFRAAVLPDAQARAATPDSEGAPVGQPALTNQPASSNQPTPTRPPTPSTQPAPGQAAIDLRDLTKRFGDHTAVNGLTLRVAPGEIFAFLGSNGAGKSTTIMMLVGLLRPTSGRVLIGGQDPWQDLGARRLVGYVPDSPMLYENLTAREHLWLIGGLYDLPETTARVRADELLGQVGLEQHADQPIRTFSLGMKRKLSIASALMHRPPVLLLDESTNGLDPRAAREVKDFIKEAARAGTTIFLTTHLLDVVTELADRVAIIDQGVLRACGTLPELQTAFGRPQGSLEEIFLWATDRRREVAKAL